MNHNLDLFDFQRWGLQQEAVKNLGERVYQFWERFHDCFQSRTRDTSEQAFVYLMGLLTMETKRNFANIARRINDPHDDGQNLQHFMSQSPWNHQDVFDQIQEELTAVPHLSGGMLTLDDSGERRWGKGSAGVKKQYLGRLGKVDLGQVGVALGYYHYPTHLWTMVDAELFLPQKCFEPQALDLLHKGHAPEGLAFESKIEMALKMIRWAKSNHLPFSVVGFDTWYGRDGDFRLALNEEELVYMADIPCDYQVYLSEPVSGIPPRSPGQKGRPFSAPQVLNDAPLVKVCDLQNHLELAWERVEVRNTERGLLTYECTARRVWTVTEKGKVLCDWLLLRREEDGSLSYSLSNAVEKTSLKTLCLWRCMRYFVERIFQDSKSELGWDELEAGKYRAWYHHTALTALALWFVAQTKLEWAEKYPRDLSLCEELGVEQLPPLSAANLRELLRAVMPLKQLSPIEASLLVVQHLLNRSRSTASRLRTQTSVPPS